MTYDVRGSEDRIFRVGKSLVELTSEATGSFFKDKALGLVDSIQVAGYGFPLIGGAERMFHRRIQKAAQKTEATYALAKYIVSAGRNLDDYVSAVIEYYK